MKSVLIVKHGALGDVVRTLSLVEPLRRAGYGLVAWVTAPRAKELLEGNPGIDFLAAAGSEKAAQLGRDFDLVLSMEEDLDAAAFAQRCCRGEFIGVYAKDGRLYYTDSSALYYDMSLLNRGPNGGLEYANALKADNTLTYAELWLKILGLPKPRAKAGLRPGLFLTEADRAAARALARRHGLKPGQAVGFNSGAGARWPSKQLTEAKASSLARALCGLGRPLLLLGGEEEAARNGRIAASLPRGAALCPAPVGLRAFAGLIELCAAVVVTDSLALHLASAVGVAPVVLIGPTSSAELDVFGRGTKLLPSGGCECFYSSRCRRRRHCLDDIADGAVVSAVRGLL